MRDRTLSRLRKARTAALIVFLGSIAALFAVPQDLVPLLWGVFGVDTLILLAVNQAVTAGIAASAPAPQQKPERSLLFVILVAAGWGAADAFFFGQGLIALILCVMGLLYFLPRAIAARNEQPLLNLRLQKALATTLIGVATFASIIYDANVRGDRAEELVAAVERYRAEKGHYPAQLADLAPEFSSEVPNAGHVVMAGRFMYSASASAHYLTYVVVPPFARRVYSFEERKWTSID